MPLESLSSSSSNPRVHPSLTSRRRSLEHSLGRRITETASRSSAISVRLQKTRKKRSTRSRPNDIQAAPYQPASCQSSLLPSRLQSWTVWSPEQSGTSRTQKLIRSPTPRKNCAAHTPSSSPRPSALHTALGMNGQRHGMHMAQSRSVRQMRSSVSRMSCTKQWKRKTTKVARADSAMARSGCWRRVDG